MNDVETSRSVHDGIHGLIRLTKEEMAVIDHPLFQRMRRISQLGLLSLIFPTATHTRFEHSIGVLHTAQHMLDALNIGSRIGSSDLYPLHTGRPGQSVRFDKLLPKLQKLLQRITRLCALVHDLGHGPLSHAFEAFMPKTEDIAKLVEDPRLDTLLPFRARILSGKNGHVEHEAVSCIMFTMIWRDIGGDAWIPQAVASVLLGASEGPETPIRPWLPLLRDIISSAPIDADRMDYLLRDSRTVGVTYGLYDADRVLKSILCVRGTDEAGCPRYRLGWRYSGLQAIEGFVTARYRMFMQLYHHKTERACNLMLHAIQREGEAHGISLVRATGLDDFLKDYGSLSDELFLLTLRGDIRPGFPNNARITGLTDQVLRRNLWKRSYEFDDKTHADDITAFVSDLSAMHPGRNFIVDRQPVRAMKGLERGTYLLDHDTHGKYSRKPGDVSWLEASSIMCALKEREQSQVRLYLETDHTNDIAYKVRGDAMRLGRSWSWRHLQDRSTRRS